MEESGGSKVTTKQIAESVNKTERTVQGWAKKTGEKMASIDEKISSVLNTGKPADYDIEETIAIIEVGLGKNAARLYRENAKKQTREVAPISFDNGLEDAFKALVRGFETLTEITRSQETRLHKIETRIEERQALLPPPQIKPRDHVSKLVREYAERNKFEFRVVWQNLYRDFGYRTNTNPKLSAQNRGMSIIDYIEAEGQIETLEAVAIDFLGAK